MEIGEGRLGLGYGACVERLTKGPLASLSHFLSPPRRFFLTWPVESPADSSSLYLLEESDTSNSDESGGAPDLDDPFFDDLFFSAS